MTVRGAVGAPGAPLGRVERARQPAKQITTAKARLQGETLEHLGFGILALIVAGALMICLALALLIREVVAHEVTLSDGRTVDYSGLKSANGTYDCCGNRDCEAVEWREVEGGKLEAMLPGFGWITVPVISMRPPHPHAPDRMHVCWARDTAVLHIRCVFAPGFGT